MPTKNNPKEIALRMLSALLSLSALAAVLLFGASCSDEKTSPSENPSGPTIQAEGTGTKEGEGKNLQNIAPDIEAADGGGADFVILNRAVSENYNAHPYAEFSSESETGDVIDDAIYRRNLFLEEKYNVKIISEAPTTDIANMGGMIKKAHDAGDDMYQLASLALSECFKLSFQGYLRELKSIPHIDIAKPWWMASMTQPSSIKGKNYFQTGEMNLGAFNTATCLFFNKQPIKDFSLEDPYALVKENKWTMDKLSEMCKAVTSDLDGDGAIDQNDRIGIATSSYAWQVFFYGGDGLFVKKDENDVPYFAPVDERTYNLITKLMDLVNNPTSSFNVTRVQGVDIVQLQMNMFEENRALFMINNIYGTIPLRALETDCGILPVPKYDQNQKDYVSTMHGSNATAMCVPASNGNTDLAGRMLEDMAYQSYVSVRPAYYDVTLKIKFARDEQSPEMLDIIFDKLIIDPVLLIWEGGQGADGLLRDALTKNDTAVISKIEANIDAYNAKIGEAAEAFG